MGKFVAVLFCAFLLVVGFWYRGVSDETTRNNATATAAVATAASVRGGNSQPTTAPLLAITSGGTGNGGQVAAATNPPVPTAVIQPGRPVGGGDPATVNGQTRRASGVAGTIPFKAGEAVMGIKIVYADGTIDTSHPNCPVTAGQNGVVTNGAVNPWTDETRCS